MNALPYVISLLNSLLSLVPAGTALFAKFQADKALLQQMILDKRVPTDAEWATLDANVKALEDQVDAAAKRVGG